MSNSRSVALSGSPSTSAEMGLMRAGDANNDNLADAIDFTILRNTFGLSISNPGYDDRADFTGDQLANIFNFNVLRGNFGTVGTLPTGRRQKAG